VGPWWRRGRAQEPIRRDQGSGAQSQSAPRLRDRRDLEAGLALVGSEVKSIRDGKVTLIDAYASVESGEAWLHQLDIGVYSSPTRATTTRAGGATVATSARDRPPGGKSAREGYTLIPLSLYEKRVG